MSTYTKSVMATLLFLAVVAMPRMTFAADSKPVVDVTYVKVNGDVAGFVELIAKGRALGKKLRPDAKVSVYVHMLAKAGPYSGMVSVSVIHPSYVDWAEGQQILTASPEWQAFMQEFMAAGYEAVSSGLSVQVADFE